jgi:sugar phosphate isomerase/epimerase
MTYTFGRQPRQFDLRRMLAFTAEHMDGIDFVGLHGQTAQDLRRMADDAGIPIACYTFFTGGLPSANPAERRQGIEDCKRGIEAAVTLGAPVVMIPTPGHPEMPRDPWRRQWVEGLTHVAPLAADAGVILTIENFPGRESPFVLADDYFQARAAIPALRLTFDSGNAGSGEDPAASFTRCARNVVHAHFKDWDIADQPAEGFRPMLDGRYYRPALIGEGRLDHRACLQAMRRAGYDRFINIEYEGDRYDPFDATRRAVDYLRGLLAGMG